MKNLSVLKLMVLFLWCGAVILTASSAQAIGLKPLRNELTIDPGKSATVKIKLLNNEKQVVKVRPEVDIYVANDDSGFPVPTKLDLNDPRNIEKWISFTESEVTIQPNSETETTFTITVPKNAEPGGRYASVSYAPIVEGGQGVMVETRVASLLLIKVSGKEVYSGDLLNFDLKDGHLSSDKGVEFNTLFENTGNVHVKPEGKIQIIDVTTGQQVSGVAIYKNELTGAEIVSNNVLVNQNNGNVLPKSKRNFDASWNKNIKDGKYKASLKLSYGPNQVIEKNLDFEVKEGLTLKSFNFNNQRAGTSFTLKFKNDGTVYEKLVGRIEVTNEYNYKVAEIAIPSDINYLRAGESDSIELPWTKVGIPNGKYIARLVASYGYNSVPVNSEISFAVRGWMFDFLLSPLGLLLLGGIVVVMIVLLNIIKKRKK